MTINNYLNSIWLINSVLIARKFSFLKASRKKNHLNYFYVFFEHQRYNKF